MLKLPSAKRSIYTMVQSLAMDVEHSFGEPIKPLKYPNFCAKASRMELRIRLENAISKKRQTNNANTVATKNVLKQVSQMMLISIRNKYLDIKLVLPRSKLEIVIQRILLLCRHGSKPRLNIHPKRMPIQKTRENEGCCLPRFE